MSNATYLPHSIADIDAELQRHFRLRIALGQLNLCAVGNPSAALTWCKQVDCIAPSPELTALIDAITERREPVVVYAALSALEAVHA